ncbi:hypothetical protein BWK47_13245 [Synechocystis sp. CACIAM 05]|nr:hypothetical protein BWK47_13245 [Synechocystis sp. CACIAM 05]
MNPRHRTTTNHKLKEQLIYNQVSKNPPWDKLTALVPGGAWLQTPTAMAFPATFNHSRGNLPVPIQRCQILSRAKFVGKQPSRRKQLRISKRLLLVVLTLGFSMASVGIMEDFQGNFWLKTYLLLGALFWGNLLIYLSFYPRWGQKLLQREQKKSGPISGPKSRHGQKN